MSSPEPYVTRRWGLEGKEWERLADGRVNILIRNGDAVNTEQNIGLYLFSDHFSRKDVFNYSNSPATVELFGKNGKSSRATYNIMVEKKDPADYVEWQNYGADLLDIRDAYVYSVIGGTESIANWDKYIANLKNAGLDEVLKEINTIYPKQLEEMRSNLQSRGFDPSKF
jgi:hypothetical protein